MTFTRLYCCGFHVAPSVVPLKSLHTCVTDRSQGAVSSYNRNGLVEFPELFSVPVVTFTSHFCPSSLSLARHVRQARHVRCWRGTVAGALRRVSKSSQTGEKKARHAHRSMTDSVEVVCVLLVAFWLCSH